jgi:hypothetical protein
MQRILCRSAWLALFSAGLWGGTAQAVVVSMDDFKITRNGSLFFEDTFSDGAPPPSAPNFPNGAAASYGTFGTFPAGSESGGVLVLNSANGGATVNALGQARLTLRATLFTNADSNDLATGLKKDDVLSLSGTFSLTSPTGPLINGYGIAFSDRAPPNGVQQFAQLFVLFNPDTGNVEVQYIFQDIAGGTVSLLGSALLTAPVGADQVMLEITRPNVSNDNFIGSWYFGTGGSFAFGGSFATPAVLFQGENFVRAEFLAAQGVPEPGTLALLGLGLAGLATARRRRQ